LILKTFLSNSSLSGNVFTNIIIIIGMYIIIEIKIIIQKCISLSQKFILEIFNFISKLVKNQLSL